MAIPSEVVIVLQKCAEHVAHTSTYIPAIVYAHGSAALRYRVDLH